MVGIQFMTGVASSLIRNTGVKAILLHHSVRNLLWNMQVMLSQTVYAADVRWYTPAPINVLLCIYMSDVKGILDGLYGLCHGVEQEGCCWSLRFCLYKEQLLPLYWDSNYHSAYSSCLEWLGGWGGMEDLPFWLATVQKGACALAGRPIFRETCVRARQSVYTCWKAHLQCLLFVSRVGWTTNGGSIYRWGVESFLGFWVDILGGGQDVGLRESVD
eukprot:1155184-Pelagomonas_calceolata.AAC.2